MFEIAVLVSMDSSVVARFLITVAVINITSRVKRPHTAIKATTIPTTIPMLIVEIEGLAVE